MNEKTNLSFVPRLSVIFERLPLIFPQGVDAQGYLVRDMAARTVFVMFYAGAVEGTGRWIRPDQVTRMTDVQALKTGTGQRVKWVADSLTPGRMKDLKGRWYAANTREPIRDETIRSAVAVGAVIEREGIPTTSSKPRYALSKEFCSLFDGGLSDAELESRIILWQQSHLSAGSRARIALIKGRAAEARATDILVRFPSGEARRMSPGPSSTLSRASIEVFAPAFLQKPAVVFLSESSRKVVAQDDDLARRIGLTIRPERNLPDIVLADLGPADPLIVFLEVVVTDGAVTSSRKEALSAIAQEAGFRLDRLAFVSVFEDRSSSVYRKLSSELAWGTFVWFASEPECILILKEPQSIRKAKLADLL